MPAHAAKENAIKLKNFKKIEAGDAVIENVINMVFKMQQIRAAGRCVDAFFEIVIQASMNRMPCSSTEAIFVQKLRGVMPRWQHQESRHRDHRRNHEDHRERQNYPRQSKWKKRYDPPSWKKGPDHRPVYNENKTICMFDPQILV